MPYESDASAVARRCAAIEGPLWSASAESALPERVRESQREREREREKEKERERKTS
jgi:hypothetical protein